MTSHLHDVFNVTPPGDDVILHHDKVIGPQVVAVHEQVDHVQVLLAPPLDPFVRISEVVGHADHVTPVFGVQIRHRSDYLLKVCLLMIS